MAEISANGKDSQAGPLGHAWTGRQGGQTILKHSGRLDLVFTVMASFISWPHMYGSSYTFFSCIIHRKWGEVCGGWGETRKLILALIT